MLLLRTRTLFFWGWFRLRLIRLNVFIHLDLLLIRLSLNVFIIYLMDDFLIDSSIKTWIFPFLSYIRKIISFHNIDWLILFILLLRILIYLFLINLDRNWILLYFILLFLNFYYIFKLSKINLRKISQYFILRILVALLSCWKHANIFENKRFFDFLFLSIWICNLTIIFNRTIFPHFWLNNILLFIEFDWIHKNGTLLTWTCELIQHHLIVLLDLTSINLIWNFLFKYYAVRRDLASFYSAFI